MAHYAHELCPGCTFGNYEEMKPRSMITLRRFHRTENYSLGAFSLGNRCIFTLEPPWKDNLNKVSCIPEGSYTCKRVEDRVLSSGIVLPVTYEVMEVPSRSGILFHVGNDPPDTHGCILVGLLAAAGRVSQSRLAFEQFLEFFKDREDIALCVVS